MISETSLLHRFRFDLILLGILVFVAACVLLARFPWTVTTQDASGAAVMPQQLGQSGVLLVIPEGSDTATTFPAMDFSFAWYNLLTQYVGPIAIALVPEVGKEPITAQLIVIPQKAAESFTDRQIAQVEQAVQRGATLILEMPTPAWASLTAMKRNARGNSTIKHFTDAPNSPLPGAYRDHLLNTPLDTQVLRLDTLDSDILSNDALLLELDGAIAHYRRSIGAGYIYVLAFNLGQAITAMQQGRPGETFQIETEEEPLPESLVLNEKLRQNMVPYADLLKTHVLMSAAWTSPMPMIWPFPNAKKSALIVTHETGSLGDEAFLAAGYEHTHSVQSSWLVLAGNASRETLESAQKQGFDIGVSFLRPPAGRVYEKYGPSFFQPIARERNMENQMHAVTRRAKNPVSTCKISGSFWARDYTLPFRKLAAAQCRIDLSYAPVGSEQYGYLFGSGFPFLPIERNGLPFPTYEMPAVLNDAVGLDTVPATVPLSLLKESEEVWNEPIVVSFHAETMQNTPTWRIPTTWMELVEYASTNGIWATSARGFMHYYTTRKQVQMSYAFSPQTRTLDARVRLPDAPFSYTLAIPRRTAHGALHDVWIDKQSPNASSPQTSGDGLLLLIPIAPGEHDIQAQYM